MLKFTLILALFAIAVAVPIRVEEENLVDSTENPESSEEREVIAIVKSESNQNADGSYNFLYESSDGSFREENAEIVSSDDDEETKGIRITGSYRYIDANGDEIVVNYTADENGFVPVGTNINKEISDAAIAAKDLPKEEPEARSLKAEKPQARALEVVKEQQIPVVVVEEVAEAVTEAELEATIE